VSARFAVIFEVQPKKDSWDRYLELAKFLKPELEQIDGFIDNERFQNKEVEGRILSLSTWRTKKRSSAGALWRSIMECKRKAGLKCLWTITFGLVKYFPIPMSQRGNHWLSNVLMKPRLVMRRP
jgi:heme-degrading monooxygenase HmoA